MSEWTSPVEERHIDFLLEEEFASNPEFLLFFLRQAGIPLEGICADEESTQCRAVRSVTTGKGETDLLVRYMPQGAALPKALLIESKIKAGFQENQAARYRERGDEGVGCEWTEYRTCLVAHEKYAVGNNDFDAVVTLKMLQDYFAGREDSRSRFRASVLEEIVRKYETNGTQIVDGPMTHFRSVYADTCDSFFSVEWKTDRARDAWWGDTWFIFRKRNWPANVKVIHQSNTGLIKLVLPTKDDVFLRSVLSSGVINAAEAVAVEVTAYGKNAAALQARVPQILVNTLHPEVPDLALSLQTVESLGSLYERLAEHLPPECRPLPKAEGAVETENVALQAMLLGFLRSTTLLLGTAMPFPLPRLSALTSSTPEDQRYFASPGLMGGFLLTLQKAEDGSPYILSEHWSRQWGSDTVRHRITASDITKLLVEE